MADLTVINNIQEIAESAVIMLPIITGLVAVLRGALPIPNRFIPALSVVLGIASGLILIAPSVVGGTVGLILGLGGTGLWEFGKHTVAGR